MRKYLLRSTALGYLLIILIGPLAMMIWRTLGDLDGAWAAITNHNTLLAFKLTLYVTAIAVPINTIFGVICGLVIVRSTLPGRGILNAFVDLPLALSPVIVGLSLVVLYGANGWFGFSTSTGSGSSTRSRRSCWRPSSCRSRSSHAKWFRPCARSETSRSRQP